MFYFISVLMKSKLSSSVKMQKRIIRVIFFKDYCERVYELMVDNKFPTVIELHLYEIFKQITEQLTGVSKLNFFDFQNNHLNLRSSFKEAKLQYLRDIGINYMLQFRLTKMYQFFNKTHKFDNNEEIQNRYQFNKFVQNVFDNYILDKQELHDLNM